MDTDNLVEKYALLLATHKVDYAQLDAILAKQGILVENRAHLKALIDDKAQALLLDEATSKSKRNQLIQGIALLSLGIILTLIGMLDIGFFTGSYLIFFVFIAYGGFLIFQSTRKEKEKELTSTIKMKRYFDKE